MICYWVQTRDCTFYSWRGGCTWPPGLSQATLWNVRPFSKRVAKLVIESWRGNRNGVYNVAWHKWHCWYAEQDINSVLTPVVNIMQFSVNQLYTGLQYCTINTLRSAISTTHPDNDVSPVGSHPLVSCLLKGMFNSQPPTPRYSFSWDIRTVVKFLAGYKLSTLLMLQLVKKAVTLMALVNADRCSDLAVAAALDPDLIRWNLNEVELWYKIL